MTAALASATISHENTCKALAFPSTRRVSLSHSPIPGPRSLYKSRAFLLSKVFLQQSCSVPYGRTGLHAAYATSGANGCGSLYSCSKSGVWGRSLDEQHSEARSRHQGRRTSALTRGRIRPSRQPALLRFAEVQSLHLYQSLYLL